MQFLRVASLAALGATAAKGLSHDATACANQIGREVYKGSGDIYRECMTSFPETGFLNSVGDKLCIAETLGKTTGDPTLEKTIAQIPACQRTQASQLAKADEPPSFQDLRESASFLKEAYKGFHEQKNSFVQKGKDWIQDATRNRKQEL